MGLSIFTSTYYPLKIALYSIALATIKVFSYSLQSKKLCQFVQLKQNHYQQDSLIPQKEMEILPKPTINHSPSDLLQIIQNFIDSFWILLFEYRSCITTTYLFLSINVMQIEALYIWTFVSFQKMRTVFRCTKRNFQRSVWEFISV